MIKFKTIVNGKVLVGFGISEDNVKRLKEGMPIAINTEECKRLFGVDDTMVTILYGKTENDIKEELSKHFVIPE